MKMDQTTDLRGRLTDLLGFVALRVQKLRTDLWPCFATENMLLTENERLRLEIELRSSQDNDWWDDLGNDTIPEPPEARHPQLILYAVPMALLRQGRCSEAIHFLETIGDKVTTQEKLRRLAALCVGRGDFGSVLDLLETSTDLGTRLEIWSLAFYALVSQDRIGDAVKFVKPFINTGARLESLRLAEPSAGKSRISALHVIHLTDHGFADEATKLASAVMDTEARMSLLRNIAWRLAIAYDFEGAKRTLENVGDATLLDGPLSLLAIDLACRGVYDEACRTASQITSDQRRSLTRAIVSLIEGKSTTLDSGTDLDQFSRLLTRTAENLARYGRFETAKPVLPLILGTMEKCSECARLGYVDESAEAMIALASSRGMHPDEAVLFALDLAVGSVRLGRDVGQAVQAMERFLDACPSTQGLPRETTMTQLAVKLIARLNVGA